MSSSHQVLALQVIDCVKTVGGHAHLFKLLFLFGGDWACPSVDRGLDASDDHRDFLHDIFRSHILSSQDTASWLESLVDHSIDINAIWQCSVLQGQEDGLTSDLNWVWHVVLQGLIDSNATVDERIRGEAVVVSTLALREGASGNDWHHVVVEKLNDDGRGDIVDEVQLIRAIRLERDLNLWACLVHQRGENHIQVEDDIADWSR